MPTLNPHRDSPAKSMRERRLLMVAGLLVIGVALLAPIWSVAFPPLLDYPNHLARAFVLAHLHDSAFTFERFYRADWGLYPYLGMDASLAVLSRVFPIEVAGRIFLSICVLSLPAAAWFFLRQINSSQVAGKVAGQNAGADATAVWALLLAYNIFVLEGFLNFALSLAVALLALGLWLRWLDAQLHLGEEARARWGRWIASAGAFTALYFTHLLGFAIAVFMVAAYLTVSRRALRDWTGSGVMALPGVIFYLYSSRVGLSARTLEFHGFLEKLKSLGAVMHGYSPALDAISMVSLAAWLLAARWRNPEFRWNAHWIKMAGCLLILFFAIPWMWGEGSDLDIRVLPLLFVMVLASVRVGKRATWLAVIPLALFGARTVNVTQHFAFGQQELSGLARSFDIVPRGALVFPIVEGDQDAIERPFTHFWAYGVIRRGWFSPYLADLPGQTPMRIIYDSYTSDGFWDQIYAQPPDWAQVQRDYDYVWAYGVPRYSAALAGIAEHIYSYGALEVYRIRKPSGPFSTSDSLADSIAH